MNTTSRDKCDFAKMVIVPENLYECVLIKILDLKYLEVCTVL